MPANTPTQGLTAQEVDTLARAASWINLEQYTAWPHVRHLLEPSLPRELRDKLTRLPTGPAQVLLKELAARQRRDRESPTTEHPVLIDRLSGRGKRP